MYWILKECSPITRPEADSIGSQLALKPSISTCWTFFQAMETKKKLEKRGDEAWGVSYRGEDLANWEVWAPEQMLRGQWFYSGVSQRGHRAITKHQLDKQRHKLCRKHKGPQIYINTEQLIGLAEQTWTPDKASRGRVNKYSMECQHKTSFRLCKAHMIILK